MNRQYGDPDKEIVKRLESEMRELVRDYWTKAHTRQHRWTSRWDWDRTALENVVKVEIDALVREHAAAAVKSELLEFLELDREGRSMLLVEIVRDGGPMILDAVLSKYITAIAKRVIAAMDEG